ncbi:MAG: hypothetical protein WCK17_19630 [Verrucomicrobiota bacterium]
MNTVEIFTDESFVQNNATVGGIVVIHDRQSETFHETLFAELSARVGLWGVCRDLCNAGTNWRTSLPHGVNQLPKGSGLRQPPEIALRQINDALVAAGALHIAAFGARKTDPKALGRWHPHVSASVGRKLLEALLDRRLFDLLKQALEIIIYEMPEVAKSLSNSGMLAVDLASRIVPCGNDDLDQVVFARQEWGVNVSPPDYARVYSIGSGDAVQMFDELVAARGGFYPSAKLLRARVVNLLDWSWRQTSDEAQHKRIRPHQIHYLADWISHIIWDDRNWITNGDVPTLNTWLNAGFDIDLARHTESQEWLAASRAWGTGNRVGAVKRASTLRNNPQRVLREGARNWFAQLDAEDLKTLFQTM